MFFLPVAYLPKFFKISAKGSDKGLIIRRSSFSQCMSSSSLIYRERWRTRYLVLTPLGRLCFDSLRTTRRGWTSLTTVSVKPHLNKCSLTLPKNKRTVINYSLLIMYERNKTACGFELYIHFFSVTYLLARWMLLLLVISALWARVCINIVFEWVVEQISDMHFQLHYSCWSCRSLQLLPCRVMVKCYFNVALLLLKGSFYAEMFSTKFPCVCFVQKSK